MARLTTPCIYNITYIEKYYKYYFEIYFDVSKKKNLPFQRQVLFRLESHGSGKIKMNILANTSSTCTVSIT